MDIRIHTYIKIVLQKKNKKIGNLPFYNTPTLNSINIEINLMFIKI